MKKMTEDDIKKELKDIKNKWLKKEKDKTEEERNEMLICENLKLLKQYQKQYPEGYEKYYWENYRCLEQDNVCTDSYSKIINVIGSIIADIGLLIAALCFVIDNNIIIDFFERRTLAIVIGFCVCFILLIAIGVISWYVYNCFKTRERSYYKIFVAMMEDLKSSFGNS